jgi:hypothetical protein
MCDGHLIEKQYKLIQLPISIHELLEASVLIVGCDKHIASKIFIIEAIEERQYVLRIERSHVPCFFLDLVEVHSIHRDGFHCVYFPILYSLTFLYVTEGALTNTVLCDVVFLFRADVELAFAHVAAAYIQIFACDHSSIYNY